MKREKESWKKVVMERKIHFSCGSIRRLRETFRNFTSKSLRFSFDNGATF